uniref:Cation-transporting P-type ATPase C-terminal domain-containing protein n=1 Tax=Zea mays TaxID=4577 RepID=A0A804M075_MAIZE
MDTLGALALATEPPTNHLMERPPVGRREPLIINIMWRNLIIMALFQVSFLLTLNFKGISLLQLKNDDPAHADKVKNTFIFNTFVFCQVFNEFNSCKPDELNVFKGISENHLFIGIIAITVVLQDLDPAKWPSVWKNRVVAQTTSCLTLPLLSDHICTQDIDSTTIQWSLLAVCLFYTTDIVFSSASICRFSSASIIFLVHCTMGSFITSLRILFSLVHCLIIHRITAEAHNLKGKRIIEAELDIVFS